MPDILSRSSTDAINKSPALNASSSQSATPRRTESLSSRARIRFKGRDSGGPTPTLIGHARAALADHRQFIFARRVVTRRADGNEPHDSVDEAQFKQLIARDDFALWWRANGLFYGIPCEIDDRLREGAVAIANLSRDALSELRATYARTFVIHVTASPEILVGRLARRGRGEPADQAQRLERSLCRDRDVSADARIDNDAAPETAAARLVAILQSIAATDAR